MIFKDVIKVNKSTIYDRLWLDDSIKNFTMTVLVPFSLNRKGYIK